MGYLQDIYVVNLETGGQTSLYKFGFGHSCLNYVNGEMLIGGVDGHLYKLDNTNTIFEDNEVSYDDDTYLKTSFEDWGLPNNWKHNKKCVVKMSGDGTVTANLKVYKNESIEPTYTIVLSTIDSWGTVYSYTATKVYTLSGRLIGQLNSVIETKKKFSYRSVMLGLENISGNVGIEVLGFDLKTAIIGDK